MSSLQIQKKFRHFYFLSLIFYFISSYKQLLNFRNLILLVIQRSLFQNLLNPEFAREFFEEFQSVFTTVRNLSESEEKAFHLTLRINSSVSFSIRRLRYCFSGRICIFFSEKSKVQTSKKQRLFSEKSKVQRSRVST